MTSPLWSMCVCTSPLCCEPVARLRARGGPCMTSYYRASAFSLGSVLASAGPARLTTGNPCVVVFFWVWVKMRIRGIKPPCAEKHTAPGRNQLNPFYSHRPCQLRTTPNNWTQFYFSSNERADETAPYSSPRGCG